MADDALEYIKKSCRAAVALTNVRPNLTHHHSPLFDAEVELEGGPDILPLESKNLTITFTNNMNMYDAMNYALNFRWWLPEGFTVDGRRGITMMHRNAHQTATADESFVIHAGETVERENRVVLEVTALSRPTPLYIPIVLLG